MSQKPSLALAYATKRREKKQKIDDNWLSAEDGSNSPFQDAGNQTDEEALTESGFLPEDEPLNNQSEGSEKNDESTLQNIMNKIRRLHMRG